MQSFTVLPPSGPTITGFEPIPAVEGQPIIIRGANFPPNTTVTIILGGTSITVTVQDPMRIVLIVPPGTVPLTEFSTETTIRLITPTGSTTSTFALPVIAPNTPVITTIATMVNEDGTGATVVITGRNFDTPPRGTVREIIVNGMPITEYTVISPTEIIVILRSPVIGPLEVRTPVGTFTTTATVRFLDPNGFVAASDSTALRNLYTSLAGPTWTERTNWLDPRRGVQTWTGVGVENGRVITLTLPNNNVRGVVATTAFVGLDSLRELDLSNNALSGDVLLAISRLKKLKVVKLSGIGGLSGEGMQYLCALRDLTTLDISNNGIVADVSGLLCCLPKAENINLSRNQFFGSLPACMLQMTALQRFDVSRNRLTDTLPWWLLSVGRLETLNLRANSIGGVIPAVWGIDATQLVAQVRPVAGVQKISANRTDAVAEGLRVLNLGRNRLTGEIPGSLGNLGSLLTLVLDSNRLSGAAPQELTSLKRLRSLVLTGNELTSIPNFTVIDRLDTVAVAHNALEFGPLEPNRTMAGTILWYSPQAEVGVARRVAATLDSALSLTQVVSGTNNRYEWRRTDSAGRVTSLGAPSAASANLLFASFKALQSGVYRCYITNPDLPALTLVARPVTVEARVPSRPPETPILLTPEFQEEDVFVRPTLGWRTVAGAAVYETELAADSLFQREVERFTTEQSEQSIVRQVTERRTGTLEALKRYYWRTRARNAAGASDWSAWAVFVTAPSNVAFIVQKVNFGDIARLDTTERVMVVRNVSSQGAILRGLTLERGTTGPNMSLSVPAPNVVIPAGDSIQLRAQFYPQNLGVQTANVSLTYSTVGTTEVLRNEYTNRLVGRGAMLKIIVPDFDTVVVGTTRVASVLFINRGFQNAVVNSLRLTTRGGEYTFVDGNGQSVETLTNVTIAVADTASALMRLTPRTLGQLAPNAVRYEANVDSAEARLTAVGRTLLPNDMVVRVGVRATEDSVAPGGATVLEVYIASRTMGFAPNQTEPRLVDLVRRANPVISGAVGYNKNVLSLSPTATTARRVRNTSPANSQERLTIPPTGWDGLSPVLVRIPCVAVAGNVDWTRVVLETIEWKGIVLDSAQSGEFTAKACAAGGKRLVTSAKATALAVVAPNPAKDVLGVSYVVREDGWVTLWLVDARGEVAQTLVQEEQAAGEYSLQARLKNVPSGAYTLRLVSAGAVKTVRVDVVR
jgi:Leucine-rich repeat (LRR) protein